MPQRKRQDTDRFKWSVEDTKRVKDRAADVRRAEANAEYSVRGSSKTSPAVRQAVENYRAAERIAFKHLDEQFTQARASEPERFNVGPNRYHAEPHSAPSHHVGSCDGLCRAGYRPHSHRVKQRRLD